MSEADRTRWDARHGAMIEVAPMPPDALRGRDHLLLLAAHERNLRGDVDFDGAGRVLEVACGRGSVACWFAMRGYVVDAVDVSGAAVEAGAAAAANLGVDDSVTWWHHDLDDGLPAGCVGPYDVVVCQRFRDPALYGPLRAALVPGGLLVVTVLSEVGESPGPFRAPQGELLAAFEGMDVFAHLERDGEASLVARR